MASDEKNREMSCLDTDASLGDKIGFWARMAWPGSRAKNLANLLGISESQAKRILGGAAPTTAQLAIMVRAWGWRFVEFVFGGLAGPLPSIQSMREEMDRIEERMRRLEAEKVAEDARGAALIVEVAAMDVSRAASGARPEARGVVSSDAQKAAAVKRRA